MTQQVGGGIFSIENLVKAKSLQGMSDVGRDELTANSSQQSTKGLFVDDEDDCFHCSWIPKRFLDKKKKIATAVFLF